MQEVNKKPYHSWMHPSLEVRDVINMGKGVFTKKAVKKGTVLVIFGGYVFTFAEESTFKDGMDDFAHQISSEFVFGIREREEIQPVDYINHSCEPNCGFQGQIFLVAMRNIKKNEQISFDYCMVLSKAKNVKKEYRFNCECGLKTCRHVVTWNDWKIPALQKKYAGYFQWYLNEKIKKLRWNK